MALPFAMAAKTLLSERLELDDDLLFGEVLLSPSAERRSIRAGSCCCTMARSMLHGVTGSRN